MAETQTTVNAPPSGTNAFAVSSIPWNGSSAFAQGMSIRNPGTSQGESVFATTFTSNNLATATSASPLYVKTTAGRACRILSTDAANAQTQTVYIINQSSGAAVAANIIASFILGPGASIEIDVPCPNGIGIYATGALTQPVTLTWS